MKLSHIAKKLWYRSGQYIIGTEPEDMALNMDGIWMSLETEFYNYQKFVPIEKRFSTKISGFFSYDFTGDPHNIGYSYGAAFTQTFTAKTFVHPESYVTLTLSHQDLIRQEVVIKFNGTPVATDDGDSNIVFTGGLEANYTGIIDYVGGVITLTNFGTGSDLTVDIEVDGQWVNPGIPPAMISSVVPVGILQSIAILPYWISPTNGQQTWSPDRLVVPRTFLWKYDKPTLYYSAVGTIDITAMYDYQFIKLYEDTNCPGRLTDVDIPGIEDTDMFFVLEQMLLGRFMQVLGRSRRAFTFNEFPITTDAKELVAEGTQIYEDARKELLSRHKWWKAIKA